MSYEIDENLRRLIGAHPSLFRGRAPAVSSYLTQGWYGLVDQLCSDIEAALGPDACAAVEIRQVKEKYGELRFYYEVNGNQDLHVDVTASTDREHLLVTSVRDFEAAETREERMRVLVRAATEASTKICETCGAPGELRTLPGWLVTLCDQHLADTLAKGSSTSTE